MHPKTCLHLHFITRCRALCNLIFYFIGFLSVFFSLSLSAATPEQVKVIQKSAENHVLNSVDVPEGGELVANAANIDQRIFATDCPAPLKTSSSSNNATASNITVLVECEPDDWRIYVPVRLTITVPMVTAASPINRGQLVTENDVTISMVDQLRFRRQGFSSVDRVIGAKTKKNIRLGDVIEQNDVCVVCRNDTVLIQAKTGEMSITTKGTALSDGSLGEQIRVKNNKSNRIIDAQVSGIGEVIVQF